MSAALADHGKFWRRIMTLMFAGIFEADSVVPNEFFREVGAKIQQDEAVPIASFNSLKEDKCKYIT